MPTEEELLAVQGPILRYIGSVLASGTRVVDLTTREEVSDAS